MRCCVWTVGAVLLLLPRLAAADIECVGDCDSDGAVAINELITGVNIALGSLPLAQCPAFTRNYDGLVTIDELVAAVSNALGRCP